MKAAELFRLAGEARTALMRRELHRLAAGYLDAARSLEAAIAKRSAGSDERRDADEKARSAEAETIKGLILLLKRRP